LAYCYPSACSCPPTSKILSDYLLPDTDLFLFFDEVSGVETYWLAVCHQLNVIRQLAVAHQPAMDYQVDYQVDYQHDGCIFFNEVCGIEAYLRAVCRQLNVIRRIAVARQIAMDYQVDYQHDG
jgi:hypothetical protein